MASPTATIEVAQHTKRETKRGTPTTVYFASFVALGLTTGSLGPTLPALAEQTHVSLSAISYVFTARSLGYVLGCMRVGRLFDTRPGNRTLGSMLVLIAAATTLVPVAGYLWLLLLIMFWLGAAEGALDVGGNALLVRVHGNHVAPFMNAMHSFFGVGALIAPLVVAQVVSSSYLPTSSYFVVALLLLPTALFAFCLPERPVTVRTKHRERAECSLRSVFPLVLFLFLYAGAEAGFAGWIFTYTLASKLGETTVAAYVTSLFWGSLTAGRILTIPIAARQGPQRVLLFSLIGSLLSLLLMMAGSNSQLALVLATLGLGLSMAPIFPTTLTLANHRMPITGKVTGWFLTGASLGATLIPLLIGQLLQALGPIALVAGTSAVLLMGLGTLAFVIKAPERRFGRIAPSRKRAGDRDSGVMDL